MRPWKNSSANVFLILILCSLACNCKRCDALAPRILTPLTFQSTQGTPFHWFSQPTNHSTNPPINQPHPFTLATTTMGLQQSKGHYNFKRENNGIENDFSWLFFCGGASTTRLAPFVAVGRVAWDSSSFPHRCPRPKHTTQPSPQVAQPSEAHDHQLTSGTHCV